MHRASAILRPIIRHETITDGPTRWSWSKLLSLGATRVLGAHWQYFENTYCEEYAHRVLLVSRGSVLRIMPVLQVFRVSVLRAHICLCSRSSVLLILPVLSVVGPYQHSHLVGLIISTRSILAASTPIKMLSQYHEHPSHAYIVTHICETFILLRAPRNIYFARKYISYVLDFTQSVTKHLDLTQLFILTLTAQALNRSPRVIRSGSISSYRYILFYIFEMISH